MDPKFHQVAMYVGDQDGMNRAIQKMRSLGARNWTHDIAQLQGTIYGRPSSSVAHMAFNYEILPGIEYELLFYDGHTRWDQHREPMANFISHVAYHVDDLALEVKRLYPVFGQPIQEFETRTHTNPHVKGIKRFREAILQAKPIFGHDIKLIQRIPWELT